MDSLRGQLLLAAPSLRDGNFRQAVVAIGEHSEEGAIGVVVNRPSQTTVADATPELAHLVPDEEPVHVGGPVQPNAAIVVCEFTDPTPASAMVVDDVGLLDPTRADDAADAVLRARVFAGYAGWGAGQLDAELENEDWIVEPFAADALFSPEPETLWGRTLARRGGRYRLLARMPLDPSVN
jgi:putative transcriptional regulator